MMKSLLCDFVLNQQRWVCEWCKRPAMSRRSQPPARTCTALQVQYTNPNIPCPLAPILHAAPATADPAAYVARLRRCLAANCKLIHRVDGRILCVGRGRRCQWLREWARFLAGGEECPHWEAIASADA